LTSPGNPEGQIYDDQTIEAIADIAEDKGIWVLIDTAYEAFIYTKTPKYFFRKRRENEIRMCTFSKTLRVPGWRIAYAIADSELVRTVATLEQNRNLCPNRLAQESLSNIFQDESRLVQLREYCRTSCIKYKKVAEKTYEQLEKIPRVKPLEPQGGFYVFLDIAGHYQSSRLMCKRLLDQCQVALVPGIDFGMEGWVRLSFAPLVDEPEKISEGIDRIDKFLEGK
jgi:aspartate aminotransferase